MSFKGNTKYRKVRGTTVRAGQAARGCAALYFVRYWFV